MVEDGWEGGECVDPGVTAEKSKGEKPEGKPRDAVDAQENR